MFVRLTCTVLGMMLSTGVAFAQSDAGTSSGTSAKKAEGRAHPEMTKDEREQMAKVHEQMATCLRSSDNKDMMTCHDEAVAQCKAEAKDGKCVAMDHHMMMMKGHKKMGRTHSQMKKEAKTETKTETKTE